MLLHSTVPPTWGQAPAIGVWEKLKVRGLRSSPWGCTSELFAGFLVTLGLITLDGDGEQA